TDPATGGRARCWPRAPTARASRSGPGSRSASSFSSLQRLLGEVPVGHFQAFVLDPLLCRHGRRRRRDDYVLPGPPVGGRSDLVLVGGLQGVDDPQDLVEVPADVERIVDHRSNAAARVDEEYGPDRGRVRAGFVEHPVSLGDLHVEVGDDWEGDVDAEILLDAANPGDVAIDAVDRAAEQG